MALIDIFNHIIPEQYFSRLRNHAAGPFARNIMGRVSSIPALRDLTVRFRMMDAHPALKQVLTLAGPAIEQLGDADVAGSFARDANEQLAQLCENFPERFLGFGASVSLSDPQGAVREMERAVRDTGGLGVQVYTNVNGAPLDDAQFAEFFAAAAELGIAIWLHPTRSSDWADYPTEERSKFETWWCLGWPYETAAACVRLVYSGIMDRHPDLKVILHHGGGMIPFLSGRLGPGMEQMGVRTPQEEWADLAGSELELPALDYFKRFYADTAMLGAPHAIRCTLDFFGGEHVLYATDMPYEPAKGAESNARVLAAIESLGLDNETSGLILSGNAQRILGLSPLRTE